MRKISSKAVAKWLLSVAILVSLGTGQALATEVTWSDLPDASAQSYEDPYRDLTYDQLDALRTVARMRARLVDPDVSSEARTRLEARLTEALTQLETAGIDPDWLISQRWVVTERRERAGTAGNPDLDGKDATLSGFVIPAPPDANGRVTAYLVPNRGMCSHVPPPPPNQLLRLVFEEAWYPKFIYEPIQVTGRLEIDPSQRVLHVVDGPVKMASTFRLDVASVEPLISRASSGDIQKHWLVMPRSIGAEATAERP